MKLFAVILMSILAYAASELEYLTFRVYYVLETTDNEWIRIKDIYHESIDQATVLREIFGDDWTMKYMISMNNTLLSSTVVKFCDNTAETPQDVNVIDLFMKTLGLEDQGCPIKPQTTTNLDKSIEAYLELENYEEGQSIMVEMQLMKYDRPVLILVSTTQ